MFCHNPAGAHTYRRSSSNILQCNHTYSKRTSFLYLVVRCISGIDRVDLNEKQMNKRDLALHPSSHTTFHLVSCKILDLFCYTVFHISLLVRIRCIHFCKGHLCIRTLPLGSTMDKILDLFLDWHTFFHCTNCSNQIQQNL